MTREILTSKNRVGIEVKNSRPPIQISVVNHQGS